MSTLSPVGRYGGRRVWRRVRTAVVLLIGVGALVAAGWEGRTLVSQNNAKPVASASTSVSTPSSSCTPTPSPTVSPSSTKSGSKAHSSRSPSVSTATKLPKPKTITLNVYNSTTRSGLARKTANLLAGRGFTIGTVSNDPTNKAVKGVAEVRYGAKGVLAARVVAAEVVGAKLIEDKRTSSDVDIALGATYKHLASAAQVKKALSPKATPTPTPSC
jgi:hypothetical protein